jgi:hypothetical protein
VLSPICNASNPVLHQRIQSPIKGVRAAELEATRGVVHSRRRDVNQQNRGATDTARSALGASRCPSRQVRDALRRCIDGTHTNSPLHLRPSFTIREHTPAVIGAPDASASAFV